MKRVGTATIQDTSQGCAGQLARFFPGARPVHIPAQVTALRPGQTRPSERTIVEYAGSGHAIFLCHLPLDFDDRVHMETKDGGPPEEAAVIAVQYHEGKKAVAVRFLKGSRNWKAQP